MADSKADNTFELVVQKVDPQSKLLRTWELKGGVSAQVTALEIERPDGRTQKMIVRQHALSRTKLGIELPRRAKKRKIFSSET